MCIYIYVCVYINTVYIYAHKIKNVYMHMLICLHATTFVSSVTLVMRSTLGQGLSLGFPDDESVYILHDALLQRSVTPAAVLSSKPRECSRKAGTSTRRTVLCEHEVVMCACDFAHASSKQSVPPALC